MDSKQSTQTEEALQQCLDVSFLDISGLSTEEQQNLFKILQVPVPEEERFPLSDHGNECVEHCPNRPPENYSPVQFGSDIPLQTEGPSGPGSEGMVPPARDAGRDCRVPMEDLPCPVEPPPLVYVPHVSQHGNTGYYTGEHLVYASDGPGNTNSGYHAGGAGGRHAGYYPGNAAAVPTPAPYYAAASSGGGIPFTTAPIMLTGLHQDISFYQSHPPPNMIQGQCVSTGAGTFPQGAGYPARMPLAASAQVHQVVVGNPITYPYDQLAPPLDGAPRPVIDAMPVFLPPANVAANPTAATVVTTLRAPQGSGAPRLATPSGATPTAAAVGTALRGPQGGGAPRLATPSGGAPRLATPSGATPTAAAVGTALMGPQGGGASRLATPSGGAPRLATPSGATPTAAAVGTALRGPQGSGAPRLATPSGATPTAAAVGTALRGPQGSGAPQLATPSGATPTAAAVGSALRGPQGCGAPRLATPSGATPTAAAVGSALRGPQGCGAPRLATPNGATPTAATVGTALRGPQGSGAPQMATPSGANVTAAALGTALRGPQGSGPQQVATPNGANAAAAAVGLRDHLGGDPQQLAKPDSAGVLGKQPTLELSAAAGGSLVAHQTPTEKSVLAADVKNTAGAPHASAATINKNITAAPCVSRAAVIGNGSGSPQVSRVPDTGNSTELPRATGSAAVKNSTEVQQVPGAKVAPQAVSSVSVSVDLQSGDPSVGSGRRTAQPSAEIKSIPAAAAPPQASSAKNATQGAGAQNHPDSLLDAKAPEGPSASSRVDEGCPKSDTKSPASASVCEPVRTSAVENEVESASVPPAPGAVSIAPAGSPALSSDSASQSAAAGTVNGSSATSLDPTAAVFLPRTSPETSTPAASAPPPVQKNWAGLFKGANASSKPAVVIYMDSNGSKGLAEKTPSVPAAPAASPEKAAVAAKDDPLSAKLGEFFSSWTLKDRGVPLMPRGMTNYTNSCFNNATLQALLSVPQIYHLFKDLGDSMKGCPRKVSSTPLCDAMVRLVNEFRPIGKTNCRRGKQTELRTGPQLDSKYILDELAKLNNVLGSGHQQDAQEYLITLLNKLIEEMQNVMRHSTGDMVISNGFSDKDLSTPADDADDSAEGQWQEVGPKNRVTHITRERSWVKTPLDSIVCGLTQSQFLREGSAGSTTVEPFSSLQLVTVHDSITSVDEALQFHARKEIVEDSKDPVTGITAELSRRTLLEELPPVLILHLKNFQYDQQTGKSTKIIKRIKFDVDLQLPKDLLSSHARNNTSASHRNYKLCAVVFHHGKNATGGHYTAVTYEQATNSWSLKDDTSVTPIEESTFLNYSIENNKNIMPYFLIYRQRLTFSHNGTDAY